MSSRSPETSHDQGHHEGKTRKTESTSSFTRLTSTAMAGMSVNVGDTSKDQDHDAFMRIVGFPYRHPTLGEVVLDPEMLELTFLYVMVQATKQRRESPSTFLQLDYSTATFPQSRATGTRPYLLVQPSLRPSECPPITTTADAECPTLLTDPQIMRYARRCAQCLLGEEKGNLMDDAFIDFLSERLGLITEYFLWSDAIVVEEWTLPVLCASLPFGFRKYYIWNRRNDFDAKFAALFGTQSFIDIEDKETFLLDILLQIVQFTVQSLQAAPYISGDTKPNVIDGIIFSHFCVLLATPVSDHDGLSRVLLNGSIGPILEAYCARMNFIVSGYSIWRNPETFLLGLIPSEAPYPNNPNSARSLRERRLKLTTKNIPPQEEQDESNGGKQQPSSPSRYMKLLQWPSRAFNRIYQSLTQPSMVIGISESQPSTEGISPPKRRESEIQKKGSIRPEVFIAISAAVLLGFLMSGRSPLQLGTK